jgi:hypothetical protein
VICCPRPSKLISKMLRINQSLFKPSFNSSKSLKIRSFIILQEMNDKLATLESKLDKVTVADSGKKGTGNTDLSVSHFRRTHKF